MTKTESNMNGQNLITQKYDTRWGVLKFRHAALGFLLGVFFFPSYFGIPVGFDLTVLRLFEIILLVFIYQNKTRFNQFINLIWNCKQNIWIALYFVVVCYTNVIRGFAINGILYTFFNWILVFYLMWYLIKYEWGVTKFIKYIKWITIAICFISLLELIIGIPPFTFLNTLNKADGTGVQRFGSIRISGMCTTANGFGLYLMLLLPICAYDEKLKRIDILKNKWIIILIILTAFLTGSRLAVGAAILEMILLVLFSQKGLRFKSFIYTIVLFVIFAIITILFQEIAFFKSLLLTFFTAWDEVFGTMISVKYGANPQTLMNSSKYRDLLWYAVFFDSWLNPFMGQGAGYDFGYWYEGYALTSVDNFYVGQYITYGLPGFFAWIFMVISFLVNIVKKYIKKLSRSNLAVLISFVGYFVSMWYLDQLQTFPIMMSFFALSCVNDNNELKKL